MELKAARRDADRTVREYRTEPGWEFTQNEAKRPALVRRVKAMLETDLYSLQMELARINSTIARWERAPRTRPKWSAHHIWD